MADRLLLDKIIMKRNGYYRRNGICHEGCGLSPRWIRRILTVSLRRRSRWWNVCATPLCIARSSSGISVSFFPNSLSAFSIF